MLKPYCIILFMSLCLPILTDNLKIKTQPVKKFPQLTEALITILEKCKLGFENILIYENSTDASFSKAISSIRSPIGMLLKSEANVDEIYTQFMTDINGAIIIKHPHDDWPMVVTSIAYDWHFNTNGTVLIVDTNNRNCVRVEWLLMQLKMAYLSKVYILCMRNSTNVAIFTHDPYGNAKQPFWAKYDTKIVYQNKWTWYGRFFRKASVCKNFLFDRASLEGITVFTAGIQFTYDDKKTGLRVFHNDFTKDIFADKIEQFEIIKKLLNIKIEYYQWTYRPSRATSAYYNELLMQENRHIDVLHELHVYKVPSYSLQVSAPIKRVHLSIFSHKQGYKTPSEKIIEFYGIWTLISLVTILTITFAVIWLKKNRNFSFAFFEVIRLLINAEILVPINTLSLKIFFSMIFLYFMVIHATFSGNLAKFLTIPVLRTNIETVEDLLDPRITKVYHSGFNFEGYSFGHILRNKSQKIGEQACFYSVVKNSNTACIALSSFVEAFDYKLFDEKNMTAKIYSTNSELEPMFSSILFRVKFPLVERWNKAILTAMETKIFTQFADKLIQEELVNLHKWQVENEINFRKICLEDLKIPFLLWICGTLLALISFFFEILIFRYQNRTIFVKTVKIKNSATKLKEKRKILFEKNIKSKLLVNYSRTHVFSTLRDISTHVFSTRGEAPNT